MNRLSTIFYFLFSILSVSCLAQAPVTKTSSQIYQQLKKLEVYGSVLYIAAHPDDENTRLLGWLANEKLVRTGYLSLTRGDGGQNLIGSEQGIDLGLIRTQELLSARAIDGAEQFFTRAYDFGYSKSPDEAMRIWGHDKILSDVVRTIRMFRPDIIITRFPTTGEGGHGHHTASAVLAAEAFKAAADPKLFPELNLRPWQAKRLLWNTFNFGGNNTTREDQFRVDCGGYNPVLGISYGEMAAESRSRHKSQGFGVAATRGVSYEYFKTIAGDAPLTDLFDGVELSSRRTEVGLQPQELYKQFNFIKPAEMLPALIDYLKKVRKFSDLHWQMQKEKEVTALVESCSGLFAEVTSPQQITVVGDSLIQRITVNNRSGVAFDYITMQYSPTERGASLDSLSNTNKVTTTATLIPFALKNAFQPYWLRLAKDPGSFNIDRSLVINNHMMPPYVRLYLGYGGQQIEINRKLLYKFTDPVKAEVYEPIMVADRLSVSLSPSVLLSYGKAPDIAVSVKANAPYSGRLIVKVNDRIIADTVAGMKKGDELMFHKSWPPYSAMQKEILRASVIAGDETFQHDLRSIRYDHIPDIFYEYRDSIIVMHSDVKIAGKRIGYIPGAGDQVPDALRQMGYDVEMLDDKDINATNLNRFDAVVTGVRAYNTNARLQGLHSVLMAYVAGGGVLVNQYNTNNNLGSMRAQIGPFPFALTTTRVTDEQSPVNFALPGDSILNYPNKITAADFEGWIQERSIYHADTKDANYRMPLLMNDPGEKEQGGGLIVANFGKGKYVYTGLAFFRQLPAGVAGAYRLFANILANPNAK